MRRLAVEFWKTLIGILREIGDENAYQRYLAREGVAHSGEAWRRFHEHRLRHKYQRAKCC